MRKKEYIRYIFPGCWNAGGFAFTTAITSLLPTILLAGDLISGEPPDLTLYIALLLNAIPHARLFLSLAVDKKDVILGKLFRIERFVGIATSLIIIVYCFSFVVLEYKGFDELLQNKIAYDIIKFVNKIIGCLLNTPFIMSLVELSCQLAESCSQRNKWQKKALDEYKTERVAKEKSSQI